MTTFRDYLRGEGRSGGHWLDEPTGLRIYVYRAIRVPGGYDLGNLDLPEELQRQGILTRFLAQYGYLPLRIQNVLNTGLEQWLLRQPEWEPQDRDRIGMDADYINPTWRAGLLTRNVREYA